MGHGASQNYDYALMAARRVAEGTPVILDFGCGSAQIVSKARKQGIEAWGADTFEDNIEALPNIPEDVRPFVVRMQGGALPFPDSSFDVVVANMVFEHIPWPRLGGALRETRRVLKPGGELIATFPTCETWFEGHLRLYFPHILGRWPVLQLAYLRACHALRLGRARDAVEDRETWARSRQAYFGSTIFLHRTHNATRLISHALGGPVENLAADYMRFRLAGLFRGRLALLLRHRLISAILNIICAKRAGLVLSVKRG